MIMSEPSRFQANELRGELRQAESMQRHTSWRAGGAAARMYKPADLADLQVFLRGVSVDEPLMAVGLGSNLLVRDGGFFGTVLMLHGALTALTLQDDGLIYVQAGVPGAKLARFAARHDRQGAEFFAGIPGTMGGMLAMNAGCYGSETWQHVVTVQVLTHSGELVEHDPTEYEIGYRHAVKREAGEEFFVGAWLSFQPCDGKIAIENIKALLAKRIASQPLNLPNAGSVFRNPPGDHAARLIELCGLKGMRIGGAQVSEKHANFIVNTGGATAADIESLIDEVRGTVAKRTGVQLHPEVKIVGDAA